MKIDLIYLLLAMLFFQSCKEKQSILSFSPEIGNGYIVPIEVNGHILNFLWDTGADKSMIRKKITDSLDIQISVKTTQLNVFKLNRIITAPYTEEVDLKVGDLQQRIQFTLDTLSIIPDPFDGVLGMDVIGEYTWLFDHKDGTIVVSNKTQDIVIDSTKEESFTLQLGNTPYLDLIIPLNDTIQERILFDTGSYGNYVLIGNNSYLSCGLEIIVDLSKNDRSEELMDSYLCEFWKKEFSVEPFVNGKSTKWYVTGKQSFKGVDMGKIIIGVEYNPAYRSFFPKKQHLKSLKQVQASCMASYFFVRRFDRFYFSYNERKLVLIKSKDQKDETILLLEQIFRDAKPYDK